MDIHDPDSIQLSVLSNGLLLIKSVTADSSEKAYVFLSPYQVRLLSEFIERNQVSMHTRFEQSHDFNQIDVGIDLCPELQKLLEAR